MKNLILAISFIFCFSTFAFAQTGNSVCPKIEVHAPPNLVNAGETIIFSATADGKTPDSNLEFEWTVSAGTIIDQQGKPEIRVATTEEMEGTNLKATVKVKELGKTCNNEASETAVISIGICIPEDADQYGKLSLEDEFGRFDNFFVSLINNPGAKGYILFEVEKTENLSDVKKRLTNIFDHIKNRNFNRDLILYDVCYAEENQTTFHIILEGATFPENPNCEKVELDLK